MSTAKNKVIVINTAEWTTPTLKAANTIGKSGRPVSVEYICKLMRLGKLRSRKIEQLGITLVEK